MRAQPLLSRRLGTVGLMASAAPSRRLRVGVLGTASIADKICWAAEQTSTCAIVAVASRSHERARRWADERGIEFAFGSYGELLSSGAVDAVYIALPCALHAEWGCLAAGKGLHVLCEKPLAASAAEARALVEGCKRSGVLLMDGQMWPHHPRTGDMLGALSGLGGVRRATCCLSFKAPHEFWTSNIRADAALEPLGCLGDLGWYCAAALDAFLAPGGELPARVFCHIDWSGDRARQLDSPARGGEELTGAAAKCRGVPISAHAMLIYASGATGSFHCGFDAARRDFFEAHCSEGVLRCDDWVHPQELDTFGTSLVQLRASPPPQLPAHFRVRRAGQVAWEERQAEACWQEVRMIERFVSVALSARGEPDTAVDASLPQAAEAEVLRWGDAACRVQRILEACLASENHGAFDLT